MGSSSILRWTALAALTALALPFACADLAGLDANFEPRPDGGGGSNLGGASASSSSSSSATSGGGGSGGSPSCADQPDGGETDKDCGGSCPPCASGKHCVGPGDCISRYCHQGVCESITAVAAGGQHTCALTTSGEVKCWGSNSRLQLGPNGPEADGGAGHTFQPVDVLGGVSVVTAGANFTCASSIADATVLCWGDNKHLELGKTGASDQAAPNSTSSMGRLFLESAGDSHVCVGGKAGLSGASCWGADDVDQLDDGGGGSSYLPKAIIKVQGLVSGLASGGGHTCAVVGTKTVCWGDDSDGQLDGPTTGLLDVTAGASHTCGRDLTKVTCWGNNARYQLGNTTGGTVTLTIATTQISAGDRHTCALEPDRSVWCWGDNTDGELGLATTTTRVATPTQVTTVADVAAISAGGVHTCAVTRGGGVSCWGSNKFEELGLENDGTRDYSIDAVPVTFP